MLLPFPEDLCLKKDPWSGIDNEKDALIWKGQDGTDIDLLYHEEGALRIRKEKKKYRTAYPGWPSEQK